MTNIGNPKRPISDFFGPFFKVRFYAPTRQPIPKGSGIFGAIGDLAEKSLKAQDQQAQAKLDAIGLDKYASNLVLKFFPGSCQMTLTLTPPYDDAMTILDSKAIQFGNTVGVTWGYENGNLIAAERLFTICQPTVSFGREITFTINGIETSVYALRQRVTSTKYLRSNFPTDLTLLTRLANLCKYTISNESLLRLTSTSGPNPKPHPVSIAKTAPIEQAASDWELFMLICKGNNLVFHFKGSEIVLKDRSDFAKEEPAYTFCWYHQPSGNKEIPMETFVTNPLPTIFLPTDYANKLTHRFNPDSGRVEFELFDPSSDPKTPAQGKTGVPNTVAGTSDKKGTTLKTENSIITPKPLMVDQGNLGAAYGKLAPVPFFGNNSFEKHRGESRDASFLANTTATITAPGHPDVIPTMNVYVKGVGKLFEGNYYLMSATHTLGQRGYDMTLEVLRTSTTWGTGSNPNTKPDSDTSSKGGSSPPKPTKDK